MAMSGDEDDEPETIVYKQWRAKTLTSNVDCAFRLQMQEAMAASLAMGASSSRSPAPIPTPVNEEDDTAVRQMTLGESSSSASLSLFGPDDALWLYFKGLVSEEKIRDETVPVAGAGIAICDLQNNLLFSSRKNLEAIHGGRMICREAAELEALLEGLNRALGFGLERIFYVCEDEAVYHCVTGEQPPKNGNIAMLLDQILHLQKKFTFCVPYRTTGTKIDHAFKSAQETIDSQITWLTESSKDKGKGKSVIETCKICFEDTDAAQMFSVNGCLHRYCFSCMARHVEAKLQNARIPKCPHEGCKSELDIASCAEFLPPNLVEVMGQRIKESSIPVSQRIYCPWPTCSELMSKDEVLTFTKNLPVEVDRFSTRKCMKCHELFCMDCKAPWHFMITCREYEQQNPNRKTLESLAKRKMWRQCPKCDQMVELLEGCNHITCRCRYEFCYLCGAEWKKKKATCVCPIWDERNIIRGLDQRLEGAQQQYLRQQLPEAQAQAQARRQRQWQEDEARAQRQQQRQWQLEEALAQRHRQWQEEEARAQWQRQRQSQEEEALAQWQRQRQWQLEEALAQRHRQWQEEEARARWQHWRRYN